MIEVGDYVRVTEKYHASFGRDGWVVKVRMTTGGRLCYVNLDGSSNSFVFCDSDLVLLGQPESDTDEYPEGTIAVYGHPANGQSVTRQADGTWTFNAGSIRGKVASYDDLMKNCTIIHNPKESK